MLASQGFAPLRGRRIGVVTNPTGVDASLAHIVDLLARAPGVELAAVFGPEHGARGGAAAGEPIASAVDPATGVPVYSLYGATRRPTAEMLAGIDLLLFDIQDIGVRTYTYLSTLVAVLEAAAEHGVEVWVLDRPVPIGAAIVEGPVLEPAFESFAGAHTVPLRHGLTAGEFARMVNEERRIGARLRVVPLERYRRDQWYDDCGLEWIAPSPNIPDVETALAYAGTVLVEGVETLSEGRGTTRPFRLIGAPWLDGRALAERLDAERLPGVRFREAWFTPQASKHQGERCHGVEIHITDPRCYRPVSAALALLEHVRRLHPDELRLCAETFDRLAGTARVREALERGGPFREIVASFEPGIADYLRRRARFLLYD